MCVAPAQADSGILLHESSTGAAVTLPEDWTFAQSAEGLMAFSADQRSFVLIAAAKEDFEQIQADVRPLILSRLDDVVVATKSIEGINERGAIEGIVAAEGVGTSKVDGEPVAFAAMALKSGDQGALVLGAWKDEAHAELVAQVLTSLHFKHTVGETGLEITNLRTGAKVTIPEGWEVVRNRKGLLATNPDKQAMALIVGWQGDFEKELKRIQTVLTQWVFEQVEFGSFDVMEASSGDAVGRVIASTGTAVDRADELPLQFKALRIQRLDKNEGALLIGAWKNEEHAAQVQQLLGSLRLPKLEAEPARAKSERTDPK